MLEIQYFKTDKGLLLSSRGGYSYKYFNDEKIQVTSTWSSKFYMLDADEITSIWDIKRGKEINPKWFLKSNFKNNPQVSALNLPLEFIEKSDNEYFDSDDDVYEWCLNQNSKYYDFSNMYERRYTDRTPDTYKPVEFTLKLLKEVQITMPDEPVDFSYTIRTPRYKGDGYEQKLKGSELYSEYGSQLNPDHIFAAFNPEIFWHTQPCWIDQVTTYKIIREHIKQSIDGKEARITSDYDFCLTVSKIIHIKPWIQKTEIKKRNNRSYAQPKFNEKKISQELVTIFECAPKAYQSYAVVKGFQGKSLEDLKYNIDSYLEDLMRVINSPVERCECCSGYGHVVGKIVTNSGEGRV